MQKSAFSELLIGLLALEVDKSWPKINKLLMNPLGD